MLKFAKVLVVSAISAACLGLAVYLVGIDEILSTLVALDPAALFVAGACIAAGQLVAAVRFAVMLKAFGVAPAWRRLLFAFAVGQISNQFLLNILGQSVSRAMALKRAGVPVGVSVMATYAERLLAAGLLFVFALGGIWYLLRYISFDLDRGGGYILFVAVSALVVGSVTLWLVMGQRVLDATGSALRWLLRLWPCSLLTILVHALTLAAYVVVLESMSPGALSWGVIAALLVVMFTSSLPISFSGWGVRELSAATALGLVNLSAGIAVSVAVSIGVLSFLVMLLLGLTSLALGRGAQLVEQEGASSTVATSREWDTWLVQGCALFCAIFVFFQVWVPVSEGRLAVNIADMAAITGLGLFAYMVGTRRAAYPLPRYVTLALAVVSLLLGVGLLSAFIQDNLGRWALINRGLGWFVILGYVGVGALGVSMLGDRFRSQIVKAVVVAGLLVCIIQLMMMAYSVLIDRIPGEIFPNPIEGFVYNQNAFAFQLLVLSICLLVALKRGMLDGHPCLFTIAFILVTLAVYYSKSRIGLLMLFILAAVLYALSCRDFMVGDEGKRQLRFAVLAIVGTTIFAIVLPYAVYAVDTLVLGSSDSSGKALEKLTASNSLGVKITHALSDNERLLIFKQAWALFTESPVLGGGLGSFVEWRIANGHPPQVIHSVVLWLMVEMGLVGLIVLLSTATWLLMHAWRLRESPWGVGLLGIVLCMGVGGLLHDFFFQRIFWFLLGVFAAAPAINMAAVRGGDKQ